MNHLPLGEPISGSRPVIPTTAPTEIPHVLKYNITDLEEGVMLSIWEPAAKNETRVKPFLYMVKYRLPSERDARKLLAHYISAYRSGNLSGNFSGNSSGNLLGSPSSGQLSGDSSSHVAAQDDHPPDED